MHFSQPTTATVPKTATATTATTTAASATTRAAAIGEGGTNRVNNKRVVKMTTNAIRILPLNGVMSAEKTYRVLSQILEIDF